MMQAAVNAKRHLAQKRRGLKRADDPCPPCGRRDFSAACPEGWADVSGEGFCEANARPPHRYADSVISADFVSGAGVVQGGLLCFKIKRVLGSVLDWWLQGQCDRRQSFLGGTADEKREVETGCQAMQV